MVAALCTAVMLTAEFVQGFPTLCAKLNSLLPALLDGCWPFLFCEIRARGRMKRQEDVLLLLFALWTGRVEKTTAAFETRHPTTFLQHYLLPHSPFLCLSGCPSWGFGTFWWGQRRVGHSLVIWPSAVIYFVMGLLWFKDWGRFLLIYQMLQELWTEQYVI